MILGQVLVNGLMLSSIYILMALGFTLIFGIMKIVNFTHGEFYMLSAFGVLMLFNGLKVNFFLSLLLSAVIVALIGILCEKYLFRRVEQDEIKTMILAFGLSIFFQNLGIIIWGATDQTIAFPLNGFLDLGFIRIGYYNLTVIFCSILLLACFYFFIKKSKTGQAMIAVSLDEEIARVQGINTNRIKMIAFGLGVFMAAIAGGLVAPMYTVSPFIGTNALMNAFIVVILGGIGSIIGAFWGGVIIGLSKSALTTYIGASEADLMVFIVILLVLLFKPSGIFGGAEA